MVLYMYVFITGILIASVKADFYYPDCEYAGLSCLDCNTQKMCLNFWGLVHWSDTSCYGNLNGYSKPYCNPNTNQCTNIRPEGCPSVSFYICLRDGLFPDLNDCSIYHSCTNNTSEQFTCPEYQVYKQEYGKCVFKLSDDDCVALSSCGLTDFVNTYPGDNSLYYSCSASSLNLNACKESEEYNLETQSCENKCKSPGLLPDPKNCSYYFTCVDTGTDLVAQYISCGAGYGFNPNTNTCELYYDSLCNELAILENDVFDLISSIPIVGSLIEPIKILFNFFGINPVTIIFKCGLSNENISTGILIFDYIYQHKTLPPTSISIIVRSILPYFPPEVTSVIETLINLGVINIRSGRAISNQNLDEQTNSHLQLYLESILSDVDIDIASLIQSFQGKSQSEINADVFRKTLKLFKIPDAHIPALAKIVQGSLPLVVDTLNARVNLPLFKIGTSDTLHLDIRGVDIVVQNVFNELAKRLYSDNTFLAAVFNLSAREQYLINRNEIVKFVDKFYFSLENL